MKGFKAFHSAQATLSGIELRGPLYSFETHFRIGRYYTLLNEPVILEEIGAMNEILL